MHKHFLSLQMYLKKFGYLEDSAGQETSALRAQEVVSNAIKDFQRFAGLNETGNCATINILKNVSIL